MWGHYCWNHGTWFKSATGARWHRRRYGCGEAVERVSKATSRQVSGMARDEVNHLQP